MATQQDRGARRGTPARQRTGGRQALWALLFIVVPVGVLFAAYYWSYFAERQASLTHQTYRALATVSRQLNARLEGIDASLKNPQYDAGSSSGLPRPVPNLEFLLDFSLNGMSTPEAKAPRGQTRNETGGTYFYFKYDDAPPRSGDAKPTAAAAVADAAATPVATPPRTASPTPNGEAKCEFVKGGTLCARTNVAALIDPLVPTGLFDDVLLVRDGDVIYQRDANRTGNVPDLDALLEQVLTEDGSGWLSRQRQADGAARGVTHPDVAYSEPRAVRYLGSDYLLFFQNVDVPIQIDGTVKKARGSAVEKKQPTTEAPGAAKAGAARSEWLLCGLKSREQFTREAGALPRSWPVLVCVIIAMAVLAWPALKLRFMGARERLRTTDVYLLVVSFVLAAGLVTFFVVYSDVQRGLMARIDRDLERLANDIAGRFMDETAAAYTELACFNEWCGSVVNACEENADGYSKTPCSNQARAALYPHFKHIIWVDGDGFPYWAWKPQMPRVEASIVDSQAPVLRLRDRAYFVGVQKDRLWAAHWPRLGTGCPAPSSLCPGVAAHPEQPMRMAVQSVQSRVDGENTVVVAVPLSTSPKPQVALIAGQWLSVIGPVMPQGFAFAVIDETGQVLFHADSSRNLQENLFQESDDDLALRSAVRARDADHLDLDYKARPHRAYVLPLRDTPWTLVTLYDVAIVDAMNAGILEAWFALFGSYVAAFVAAGLLLQLFRRRYRAEWLWPDPSQTTGYLQAALLVMLTAVLLAAVIRHSDARAGLTIAVALPPMILALLYVRLKRGRLSDPARVAAVILAGCLFVAIALVSARSTFTAVALSGIALAWGASIAAASLPERSATAGARVFRLAYVGLLFALLVAVAILPAGVFVRDAFQFGVVALAKVGQLQFAQSLAERAQRIREEYRERGFDTIAIDERLAERRDIYEAALISDSSAIGAAAPAGGPLDPCRSPGDAAPDGGSLLAAHLTGRLLPYLPATSDTAALFQRMADDRPSDGSWMWTEPTNATRRLRLTWYDDRSTVSSAGDKPEPVAGNQPEPPTGRRFWLETSVPSTSQLDAWGWGFWLMIVATAVVLGLALLRSMATRVFLMDLAWPDGAAPAGAAPPQPLSNEASEAAWSSADEEQRLTLIQLAEEGFVNPNSAPIVGALVERGLIVRDPAFRVTPGFDAFVGTHAAPEQVTSWERRGEPSRWAKLQTPLLICIVVVVAFLWITQPGLLDTTTGLVASVTAALPLIVRLFGLGSEAKPAQSAPPPKADDKG
jgi:hypothetical protein